MIRKTLLIFGTIAALVVFIPPKFKSNKEIVSQISGAQVSSVSGKNNQPKKPLVPQKLGVQSLPMLQAKSALALDLSSGEVLYKFNEDQQLPIASLTKIMTAMVTADKLNKDLVVTVNHDDVSVIGSKMGLVENEKITVQSLLYGLLIPSGNDAAEALANFAAGTPDKFVEMMNYKAGRLGLSNTHYGNPIGLDSPDNYSTAADLAKLTQEFLKYTLLAKIVDTKEINVYSTDGLTVHRLKTSNKLLLNDPEVVGVKTGYTDDALGNLIVKDENHQHPILTIVLNTPDREGDTQKLLDWTQQAYAWK